MVTHLRSFLLVGVNERMYKTVCLLAYHLGARYLKKGKSQCKPCRPIEVWTPEAEARLVNASRTGWAVFVAANTVLDERIATATAELKQLAKNGISIEAFPHIGTVCFSVSPQVPDLGAV
mmetsp:Transcript_39982/g.113339  ORF Transcript_39982/g.113339 Transcript_39982/m.113339 type:complete len:120 (+) Transcript_39982:197-556(+)